MPPPRDKATGNKYSPKSTQTTPTQLDSSPSPNSDSLMEYNIIDNMKKTRANITFHELSKLKHQHKLLLKELKGEPTVPLPATVISQFVEGMERPLAPL